MTTTDNPSVSSDQSFYDQEPTTTREVHDAWMKNIENYFNTYRDRMEDALNGSRGIIAELGAGSCGLSLYLSKSASIKQIYSVDISEVRMKKLTDISNVYIKGDTGKLKHIQADFNQKLPFNNESLDAVFFDASMHHSRSLWILLSECHRILRPKGLLIAQREAFLSVFRAHSQLAQIMETPEIAANVSENAYLRSQYEYYLMIHDFKVDFVPRYKNPLKSILRTYIKDAFCDGTLFCVRGERK